MSGRKLCLLGFWLFVFLGCVGLVSGFLWGCVSLSAVSWGCLRLGCVGSLVCLGSPLGSRIFCRYARVARRLSRPFFRQPRDHSLVKGPGCMSRLRPSKGPSSAGKVRGKYHQWKKNIYIYIYTYKSCCPYLPTIIFSTQLTKRIPYQLFCGEPHFSLLSFVKRLHSPYYIIEISR